MVKVMKWEQVEVFEEQEKKAMYIWNLVIVYRVLGEGMARNEGREEGRSWKTQALVVWNLF